MLLYHYTTLENFIKIIKEDAFKLSSFERANDYKEKSQRIFDAGVKIQDYKYFSTCAGERKDKMSIRSFSNSMMWYHYGDKCRGVCIEFDLDSILALQVKPLKNDWINYRDGVRHIDKQPVLEYLMEKRTCWQGENEYRLIYSHTANLLQGITSCITGIHWGIDLNPPITTKIKQYQIYVDSEDGRFNRFELKNNAKAKDN